jgi:hypothetical protein
MTLSLVKQHTSTALHGGGTAGEKCPFAPLAVPVINRNLIQTYQTTKQKKKKRIKKTEKRQIKKLVKV